jgi:hypothetical protein
MRQRPELVLRGETYTSQKLLVDALTASAKEARKSFKPGRFSASGWKRMDPEAHAKAIELGEMRRVLQAP